MPLAIKATLVTEEAVVVPPKVEDKLPPPKPDTSEQDRIEAEELKRQEDARVEKERLSRLAEEEAERKRRAEEEAEKRRKADEAEKGASGWKMNVCGLRPRPQGRRKLTPNQIDLMQYRQMLKRPTCSRFNRELAAAGSSLRPRPPEPSVSSRFGSYRGVRSYLLMSVPAIAVRKCGSLLRQQSVGLRRCPHRKIRAFLIVISG